MSRILPFSIVFFTFFLFSSHSFAQEENLQAETVIHLLSYVSKDYSVAIQDGKVVNEAEYVEQIEFVNQAHKMIKNGSFLGGKDKEKVLKEATYLIDLVDAKDDVNKIQSVAIGINDQIIQLAGIKTAPKVWPNYENGKKLYQTNCAICHGEKGDGNGPGAKGLEPAPTDFTALQSMANLSPFQAYTTIRLGVQGTAMVSYSNLLSDSEMWDLAFYINSVPYVNDSDTVQLKKIVEQLHSDVSLAMVANLTDYELEDTLQSITENEQKAVVAFRTIQPEVADQNNSLFIAEKGLKNALESYKSGNKTLAITQAIKAYLEGIEPIEARLKAQNNDFMLSLEQQMFGVRQAINQGESIAIIEKEINKALDMIQQARDIIEHNQLSYWLTFFIAASIFLREGLEAFLILAVIIALIRSAGVPKALPWLHGGWVTAVVLGIAGWFLSDYILQFGGKNREIMEGLVALLAVVILMWAGFWLHSKTSASKWQYFIKEKVGGYLKKDKMFGLSLFSFIIVFREAFEVVLFLQAVNLEVTEETQSAIGLGVIAAIIGIAVIAVAFLKFSKRISVRLLFKYSSWFIVLLAVILIGKGVHALQESGWLSIHSFGSLQIEWLGIYPFVETFIAQVTLILLIIIGYVINSRSKKVTE